jgi:hypothetical protein
MNRSLMTLAGFLVLLTILAGSGCAPMPYQGPYYPRTEVIVIYEHVPVPYPVPGEVGSSEPLPERHTPLKKPTSQGNPRIKTPRSDRTEKPPVVARGGGGRTTKKPGLKRR